jgi:hypothetical protein
MLMHLTKDLTEEQHLDGSEDLTRDYCRDVQGEQGDTPETPNREHHCA